MTNSLPFVRLYQERAGRVYFVKFDDSERAHDVTEMPDGLDCDCPGFTYRRGCRHVRAVAKLLPAADRAAAALIEKLAA